MIFHIKNGRTEGFDLIAPARLATISFEAPRAAEAALEASGGGDCVEVRSIDSFSGLPSFPS
jgi:hypothetical protein